MAAGAGVIPFYVVEFGVIGFAVIFITALGDGPILGGRSSEVMNVGETYVRADRVEIGDGIETRFDDAFINLNG